MFLSCLVFIRVLFSFFIQQSEVSSAFMAFSGIGLTAFYEKFYSPLHQKAA